jgi:tetratricopeptide (TPR) repeat protein
MTKEQPARNIAHEKISENSTEIIEERPETDLDEHETLFRISAKHNLEHDFLSPIFYGLKKTSDITLNEIFDFIRDSAERSKKEENSLYHKADFLYELAGLMEYDDEFEVIYTAYDNIIREAENKFGESSREALKLLNKKAIIHIYFHENFSVAEEIIEKSDRLLASGCCRDETEPIIENMKTRLILNQFTRQNEQCIEIMEKLIPIKSDFYGIENEKVIKMTDDLCRLYAIEGELNKAEKTLKNFLAEVQEKTEASPLSTAEIMKNLASFYLGAGKLKYAIEYSKKSLKLRKAKLPENHPLLAENYLILTMAYNESRKLSKSVDFCELYLKNTKENNRQPNPTSLSIMVEYYIRINKMDEALKILEELRDTYNDKEGYELFRISIISSLHTICKQLHKHEKLESLADITLSNLSESAYKLIDIQRHIANNCGKINENDTKLEAYLAEQVGENCRILEKIIQSIYESSNINKTIEILEMAVDMIKGIKQPNIFTIPMLLNLAKTKVFNGDLAGAEDSCQEAQKHLRIMEKQLSSKSGRLFNLNENSFERKESIFDRKDCLLNRTEEIGNQLVDEMQEQICGLQEICADMRQKT